MMNPLDMNRDLQPQRSGLGPVLATGCVAFVIGIGLTVGYVQWEAQKEEMAEMARTIEGLQAATQDVDVTRDVQVELIAITPPAPAVVPVVEEQEPLNVTTASTLEALLASSQAATAAPDVPEVVAVVAPAVPLDPIDPQAVSDAAGFQSVAVTILGVEAFIAKARAGQYTLRPQEDSVDGSATRARIVFPNFIEDQERLEQMLAVAAADGLIPFSDTVRRTDGSFDGNAILFDLVADAL
jgi:hypothetical protein